MGNTEVDNNAAVLDLLVEKVYQDGGRDFREYKRTTVMRRLERRLRATGSKTCPEYMQFLDIHPEEYHQLAEDLTIKVSDFFRSPYTFAQVVNLVIPEVVSHKRSQGGHSLRFWSAACARGEEPYSIAILLADSLGNQLRDFNISIYATDISWWALGKARAGIYTPKKIEELPAAILESYFTRNGDFYEVRDNVRQMVSFSYFDLTSTMPPFSNLDCIFCCNVLIYLQRKLQERVLNMLYDLLATPGYLILGDVETLTNNLREKLECLDSTAKIYKKNGMGSHV